MNILASDLIHRLMTLPAGSTISFDGVMSVVTPHDSGVTGWETIDFIPAEMDTPEMKLQAMDMCMKQLRNELLHIYGCPVGELDQYLLGLEERVRKDAPEIL